MMKTIKKVHIRRAREAKVGTGKAEMSTKFPQLCKWNGFAIDSPRTEWDDCETHGKTFTTLSGRKA